MAVIAIIEIFVGAIVGAAIHVVACPAMPSYLVTNPASGHLSGSSQSPEMLLIILNFSLKDFTGRPAAESFPGPRQSLWH